MTRSEILKRAEAVINGQREQDYGSPESNFGLIGQLWTVYLDTLVTAQDVANLMTLFKIARIKTGRGTEDSYIDAVGYMACGGEIATEAKGEKPKDYLNTVTDAMKAKYIKFLKDAIEEQTEDKHIPTGINNGPFMPSYPPKEGVKCCCTDTVTDEANVDDVVNDLREMSDALYRIARRLEEEADEDDNEGESEGESESEWPDEDPTDWWWWTDSLTGCQVGTSADGWVHVSLNRHTLPFGTAGFSDKTVDALIKSIGKSINEEVVDENKRNMMAMLWAVKRYKEMKEDEDDED